MTKKQMETIKDNLTAYMANFGYIRIESADYGEGFYIYTDENREPKAGVIPNTAITSTI